MLQQYLTLNRIPRGLRSQIIPTYDDLQPYLLIQRERELTNSSRSLINILIENADRKMRKLLEEIETLEEETNI